MCKDSWSSSRRDVLFWRGREIRTWLRYFRVGRDCGIRIGVFFEYVRLGVVKVLVFGLF